MTRRSLFGTPAALIAAPFVPRATARQAIASRDTSAAAYMFVQNVALRGRFVADRTDTMYFLSDNNVWLLTDRPRRCGVITEIT